MKDKDLDKLFNEKLSSSAPSFSEEAWEKAEQLLNKADSTAMDKLFAEKLARRSISFDKAAWLNAKKLINAAGMGSNAPIYKTLAFYLSAASVAGLIYLGIITSSSTGAENILPITNTDPRSIVNELPNTTTPQPIIDNTVSGVDEVLQIKNTASTNNTMVDSENTSSNAQKISSTEANLETSGAIGSENTVTNNSTIATNHNTIKIVASDIFEKSNTPTIFKDSTIVPSIVFLKAPKIQPIAINLPGPIYNQIKPLVSFSSPSKHYIGLIGGPMATKYANGGRYKNSFFIGAHYARHISSNWYLNANILYQKTEAQNISKEFKDISYGFGSSKKFTTVSAQNLHYLELPIYATYSLSNRQSIDVGGYVSYLINASSKITEVSEISFESTQVHTKTGWGLNDGINSLDAGIIIGYNYTINDNLRLGGRLNYGLTDITKNTFYQDNSYDNHFQLRLVLDYKLFNK